MTDLAANAFREGYTARHANTATNPYRQAIRAFKDADSQDMLRRLARHWDEGFACAVSQAASPGRERSERESAHDESQS